MRILFMGTSGFAIPTLRKLMSSGKNIVGVITQTDKRAGRGRKLCCPPIKNCAVDVDVPVLQFKKVNSHSAVEKIRALSPDLIIVVSYGQILRKKILEIPPKGIFNVHASLLPKYRGAAPINWAIVKGEKVTGVTTFFIEAGMDTGDIILQRKTEIKQDETAGELHDRLAVLGADLALKTLELIEKGEAPRIPQEHEKATYAPCLSKEDGEINWKESAEAVYNFVRGMNSWPIAWSKIKGMKLRIYRVHPVEMDLSGEIGSIVEATKESLILQTGDGLISLDKVQPRNSRAMNIKDFLNGKGQDIEVGDRFEL